MIKIDLHGVKHEDVSRRLDIFFYDILMKNVSSVEIITGISDRMKDIVKKSCNDYNFKVYEHPTNVGCLIISLN